MGTIDWNQYAKYYNKIMELETEYTKNQIDCFPVTSKDSVLDVGCGPGRIAISVAKIAKKVTALDAFDDMIKLCEQNAKKENITNLTVRKMDWKDAVIGENIKQYDIVIASRSLGMTDPKKLNAAAKKYVILIGWVPDHSPSIGALFENILEEGGIKFSEKNDPVRKYIMGYQYAFHQIYDMGAFPNVRVVKDGFKKNYPNREAAYSDLRSLRKFPDECFSLFRTNADRFLSVEEDKSVTYCCEKLSYVLWWKVI